VRARGNRAYVSGHLPLQPDGTLAEPGGEVGAVLSIEQGAAAARLVGLAMLGSFSGSWASWSESQRGCVCWGR
jgi:hypothetical protein